MLLILPKFPPSSPLRIFLLGFTKPLAFWPITKWSEIQKIDYKSRVTGHIALTRACALGCLGAIEALLDRGADINRVPILRPRTPTCHGTPQAGSRGLAPPLTAGVVAARVATNAEEDGRIRQPPLIIAAAAGHAAVVRLLLERGADAGIRDRDGRTAADVAKREAFVDVLAELARVTTRRDALSTS